MNDAVTTLFLLLILLKLERLQMNLQEAEAKLDLVLANQTEVATAVVGVQTSVTRVGEDVDTQLATIQQLLDEIANGAQVPESFSTKLQQLADGATGIKTGLDGVKGALDAIDVKVPNPGDPSPETSTTGG